MPEPQGARIPAPRVHPPHAAKAMSNQQMIPDGLSEFATCVDAPLGALRSKRNLRERFGTWSGADMCAASAAARSMPRAQMGVRRSGPIQAHALEALVAKLVFPIRSLDRAPSLSFDLPTPRQPRGRDDPYTAATGAR